MHRDPPSDGAPSWDDTESDLVSLAAIDLDLGDEPRPTLTAFAGDQPLAFVGLRPFAPGEALQALIEVLALLLPLGADRVAFAAPARAWSFDDPIPPVCDAGDLRQRVLLVAIADGHRRPCRLSISLHPFTCDPDGATWGDTLRPDEPPESALASALAVLIDARNDLDDLGDTRKLAAQFGRVLLLGHEVALSDAAAEQLELASAT